jgi:GntR family transcriptional regulator/MocR family aminotransferase
LVEDPGYAGAQGVLAAAGAHAVPVPVDGEGIDMAAGAAQFEPARLVYVTPSYQFPLGVTMSLARRLALLDWAQRANAWVLEDDYDSEYRYAGRPIAALQGLDAAGRVIYVGTFSKVLFPALRLAYLVVPADLVDAFVTARALTGPYAPSLEQAVLADFIVEGHFGRHIRRMRALYRERQAVFIEAARALGGLLDVHPSEAGMHVVGWLPEGLDDVAASRQAARLGVEAPPISQYCVGMARRSGLVLGYTAFTTSEIRDGVRRLAAAIHATRAAADDADEESESPRLRRASVG